MGNATDSFILIIWVEELVWQALLSTLEFSAILFDVVSMEGEHSRKFQNAKRSLKKLKSLLIRNLFEWSRVWGFTYCTSVLEFHDSISCAVQFFLTLCVHHREHKVLVLSSIVIAALSNIQQLFLFLYLLYRAYALKVIAMMLLSNRHTIRLIHPDHECLESILCKEILLLLIHIEG